MSSLVSAKGPSTTVRFVPENFTRAPLELGWRPSPANITPAFTSSSSYFPISVSIFSSGSTPASVFLSAFSRIMNFMFYLLLYTRRTGQRRIDTPLTCTRALLYLPSYLIHNRPADFPAGGYADGTAIQMDRTGGGAHDDSLELPRVSGGRITRPRDWRRRRGCRSGGRVLWATLGLGLLPVRDPDMGVRAPASVLGRLPAAVALSPRTVRRP